MRPMYDQSRRCFLKRSLAGLAVAAAGSPLQPFLQTGRSTPRAPVAIARCQRYDFESVKSSLSAMFDQIEGVRSLVKGKTLTIKVNLTGGWDANTSTLSPLLTVFTHPMVTLAACSLFYEYGARCQIICDSLYRADVPKTVFQSLGYDVALFESLIPGLQWEDTRNLGSGSSYKTLQVGSHAHFYRSFELNYRYVDTDVLVSIPKLKTHQIAGITLSMKNLFGITPSALYSSEFQDENSTNARVAVLHAGGRSAAGGEVLPVVSFEPGYRVPRVVVDLIRARPIDLSIIDGIVSMYGGEGQWGGLALGVTVPNVLIAGRNCVCVDAVAAAVMGYNPDAPDGDKPFHNGSNTLRLAAEAGIGTHLLQEIEVVGLSIGTARHAFLPVIHE